MSELQRQQKPQHTSDVGPSVRDLPVASRVPEAAPPLSNQALQRLLRDRAIQPKLAVSAPTDVYEREADHVADAVLRAPAPDAEQKKITEQKSAKKDEDKVKRAVDAERKKKTEQKPAKKDDDKVKRAVDTEQKKKAEEQPKKKDDKVRRQPMEEAERRDEDNVLHAKAEASGIPDVSPQLEASLSTQRGGGQQLPDSTQEYFEPRFGQDLGNVRVHDDSAAADAARQVQAQAFTRGQDIYFAAGRYQPQADSGRRLLAHELTHTLQNQPARPPIQAKAGPSMSSVQRQVIQRLPEGGAATTDGGELNEPAKTITFQNLPIPRFKFNGYRGDLYKARAVERPSKLRRMKGYDRESMPTRQGEVWRQNTAAAITPVVAKLQQKAGTQHAGSAGAAQPYVFTAPTKDSRNPLRYFIGDLPTIAREMIVPSWDHVGAPKEYQIDHIVEAQVANWHADLSADKEENLELLDATVNRESGNAIKQAVNRKVSAFININRQFKAADVRDTYDLVFNNVVPGEGVAFSDNDCWTFTEIKRGDHVNAGVQAGNLSLLTPGEGRVYVFSDITGGVRQAFAPTGAVKEGERDWLKPFEITGKSFQTGEAAGGGTAFGTLTIRFPADNKKWRFPPGTGSVTVNRMPGAPYAGYINRNSEKQKLYGLRSKNLSPVQIDSFDISANEGMLVVGKILPELPLIRGTGIDFELTGNNIRAWKEFGLGDFHVPAPFRVTDTSLTVSVDTAKGLGLAGQVDFGIDRVGQGYFKAEATTGAGIELEGHFAFDSNLFNPAAITLGYRDGKLSGEGVLGIPEGRVRGIRRAQINVSYANERLQATGTADLTIPGVQHADVAVNYSEAEGLAIGGTVQLSDTIPGIRSGSIEAKVRQREGAAGYTVSAHGTAVPKIPGVNTTLDVSYDDGAFNVQGSAAYAHGMLSGSLQLGATNRPLNPQGQPTAGAEPTTQVRAYGGGTVTIRIAPWLQGTVGLRILPNGELEVSGSIGLPAALDVFPEKRLDKNIFSLGLDIPIVGVAVAGQRIGIFATIRGGLDASAGIGPGQLRELGLSVNYKPAHEEQTHVSGHAELYIPAHAGLRLFVRGGLGAGIPIVSATAALEVSGMLGVEGAATASVELDWTPRTGLRLDAMGQISAQPKFRFELTGMVLVEADLLVSTIELYSKRWNLASFEYGSDLRFGIRFPVHYREGQPFNVNLSDVQFDVPHVDAREILADLVHRIA